MSISTGSLRPMGHPATRSATARFGVRVFEGETDFVVLRDKVIACAESAARATGTKLTVTFEALERGMNLNEAVTRNAVENARDYLGLDISKRISMGGMSDFGNLSHLMPATHFSTATWPAGVTAHTEEAVAADGEPAAFAAALDAAKIEAMVAIDLLANPDMFLVAKQEFGDRDTGTIPEIPEAFAN
jgi:metal-dependent amidase/aminoacylase/carboxypeptidase family protein